MVMRTSANQNCLEQQVAATAVALETVLGVYRGFIAYAANL
jgi:hypothetical protein